MPYNVILKNGITYQVSDNETLLDGALRSGIVLPYSCKIGRCNTCACTVLCGKTTTEKEESSLPDSITNKASILTCVRLAQSDVYLDLEDLSYLRLPRAQIIPVKVYRIANLNSTVLQVILKLPRSINFIYRAGQYIDIIKGKTLRSYSIAGDGGEDNHIEIHIKYIPSGLMSKYWFHDVRVGDLLRLHGPNGTFCLRNVENKHLIFLATGTGIAPIKAILEDLSQAKGLPKSTSLYWGMPYVGDHYWAPSVGVPNFLYRKVVSRTVDKSDIARYVQNAMCDDVSDFSDAVVYACGSESMITEARTLLIQKGLKSSDFYCDSFVATGNFQKVL